MDRYQQLEMLIIKILMQLPAADYLIRPQPKEKNPAEAGAIQFKTFLQQQCCFNVRCLHENCNITVTFAQMKSFSFIMAVFLLLMSLIPCGDSVEGNAKTAVQVSTDKSHKQHSHSSEVCSPFCICSCCVISTYFVPDAKPQISKVEIPTQKFPLYNVVVDTEAHYSIWQPPQLS